MTIFYKSESLLGTGVNKSVTKKNIFDEKEMREITMALKVKQNMLQMKIDLTCREMHQMIHF